MMQDIIRQHTLRGYPYHERFKIMFSIVSITVLYILERKHIQNYIEQHNVQKFIRVIYSLKEKDKKVRLDTRGRTRKILHGWKVNA